MKQNLIKAGEHQTPKSQDMVDETHDSIRQFIVRKDGWFNALDMEIAHAVDMYDRKEFDKEFLLEIQAAFTMLRRRLLSLLEEE